MFYYCFGILVSIMEEQKPVSFSTRNSGIIIGFMTCFFQPFVLIISLILLIKERTRVFAQGMLIGMIVFPLVLGGLCLGITALFS
jgi:ethanolamine transporter EutH